MAAHHRLGIASIATDTPMGAEAYQEQIATRAANALRSVSSEDWRVRRLIVRSLRSPLPGNRRIPLSAVATAGPSLRRRIGGILFGRDAVTHRMNLELPPSRHGDVVTLHDIVAWRFEDESAPVAAAPAELRAADAVVCVSEFTAQEATDLFDLRNVHVIPNGVDERFFDPVPLTEAQRTRFGIPSTYVLHAGGAAVRKNLEGLAAAWPTVHRARPDLRLVLAGPEHPRRQALFAGMAGVVLTGRLPDTLMPGLVAGAEVVVVPSLYEGFGLPALEAMAANVPLVAAATSSLPEVVGQAGILVSPTPDALAEGVLTAASDDSSVARMLIAARERASRFTWSASAAAHARLWASL